MSGIYDNLGYDGNDESWSMNVLHMFKTLTAEDRTADLLHDKYKATFWQNMRYPYRSAVMNTWSSHLGGFAVSPRWQVMPLLAASYQDGRAQWFINPNWIPYPPYNDLYMRIIFYDDRIEVDPPSTNPTAMHFNGPGLVTMRTNWEADAAVGLFLAGEGISRRYEDGNSFLLGRKVDVVVQAGSRMTHSPSGSAGDRHNWYILRSISRNTIQILDPEESWDIELPGGTTGPLHSGTRLSESQNFGGQIFKTGFTGLNYQGSTAFPLGIRETSNITKYEHRPDLGYTYTVGDSAAAYTRKIDLFEREFLFLRPDVFVIFDRVNSVNPNFKKVWSIHTVDKPATTGTASASGVGMRSHENARNTVISNLANITYLDTLLPKHNKIVTRGGDTVLVDKKPLSPGLDISAADIQVPDLDIPRWLEIFAVGRDTVGSLTIYGETKEGDNSEVITFGSTTAVANSSKHWTKITRIATTDMEIEQLTISSPHYFDVETVSGTVYSFAPNTDRRHVSYTKQEHLGQWTLNVEASEPKQLDNFLNVFALKDPGVPKPQTTLLEGPGVSGVLVGSFFAVFANDRGNIEETAVTLPGQGAFEGLFLNLEPESEYFYRVNGKTVELARSGSSASRGVSSAMGTLKVTVLIE